MNRNFTAVKKTMCLLLIDMEKEVQDVKGNEMCTDRTLWNILCEMHVQNYVLLCEWLVCFSLVTVG